MIHAGRMTTRTFKLLAVLTILLSVLVLVNRVIGGRLEQVAGDVPGGAETLITVLGYIALGSVLLGCLALIVWMCTFWLLMLIDIIQRTFPTGATKIVWVLAVIFLGIFAAIPYYWIVMKTVGPDQAVVT
jgi:hypothetical protein